MLKVPLMCIASSLLERKLKAMPKTSMAAIKEISSIIFLQSRKRIPNFTHVSSIRIVISLAYAYQNRV